MERLKIKEAVDRHEKKTGKPLDYDKLLSKLFPDDEPGVGTEGKPLSRDRKRILLTYWDRGEHLTRVRPRHIMRLAEFFGITLLRDIVQYTSK